MMLEYLFFKSFFLSFIIGVFLCTLVITIFLGFFTNNNYDKRTSENIINLEKKYSKLNLNSVNVLFTTSFLTLQAGLNEQITSYIRISKRLLKSNENYKLNTNSLLCGLDFNSEFCENFYEESEYMAVWLLDDKTREEDLYDESKKEALQQLIVYNDIIPNIDSILQASPDIICFYFYFEKTELYTSFPLSNDCINEFFYFPENDSEEEDKKDFTTCLNEEGEFYTIYKIKCESFYKDMLKSNSGAFDNNYLSDRNKTIFVNNFYNYADDDKEREYSICIKFDDPITKAKGYACADVDNEDMVSSLEQLNSNIVGYFFVSNVGFSNVFYYPDGPISPRTSIENIYKWDFFFF